MLEVAEVLALAERLRGQVSLVGAKQLCGAVEKLHAAGDGCDDPYSKVEAKEDSFLCRAGGEAVHCVGAREAATGELGLHLEAIQPPLSYQKTNFCQYPEGHVDNVEHPQMPLLSVLLAADLAVLRSFFLLVVVMHGIHEEKQRRCGNEDNVKHPEPVLGDGEGHVVAHLFAAWLEGVTGKLLLLVFKEVTGHSSQDQYPEHKHQQEPETAEHWRMRLEVTKEVAEEAPLTHDCGAVSSIRMLGRLESYPPVLVRANAVSGLKQKPRFQLIITQIRYHNITCRITTA